MMTKQLQTLIVNCWWPTVWLVIKAWITDNSCKKDFLYKIVFHHFIICRSKRLIVFEIYSKVILRCWCWSLSVVWCYSGQYTTTELCSLNTVLCTPTLTVATQLALLSFVITSACYISSREFRFSDDSQPSEAWQASSLPTLIVSPVEINLNRLSSEQELLAVFHPQCRDDSRYMSWSSLESPLAEVSQV